MINIEHLQVVECICVEGSFQKASEKLHKVRSAISYSVKQVEGHYGITIFDRSSYRVQLTAQGKLLLVNIRRLLKQANEFESSVQQLKGEIEPELKLGVSSLFPIAKITDLLLQLKHEFPQTTIHLEIEVASGERMLLEQQVDIAIYGTPQCSTNIDYLLIDTLPVPAVIAKSMLAADNSLLSELDLSAYPQIIVKSSDGQSRDSYILEDTVKWYVTDLSSKKALISAGLGWGRLPLHMIEGQIASQELVHLEQSGPLNLPIYVAKLKHKVLGPVAQRIWHYFNEL